MRKHQPYRKNDGSWSCRVCRYHFHTRPNKANCPGILRIEQANDDYKTVKQWAKLGFEVIKAEGDPELPRPDAISIIHSTDWHAYYHRDHVRGLTQRATDAPKRAPICTCSMDDGIHEWNCALNTAHR